MLKNQKGLTDDSRANSRLIILVVIITVIVLCALWWTRVYESPSNVFWGMIDSSLSTTSVNKQLEEKSSGDTLNQNIQLSLGSADQVHSFATLNESGTNVQTEEINTPTSDYVRYTSITTPQKSKTGKPLDFKSILGVWGKAETKVTSSSSQLFSQTVLGVVPIGDVSPQQRQALVKLIHEKDVYSPDFSKVTKTVSHGVLQYTYVVNLKPEAYFEYLKAFAKDMGLASLVRGINPQLYATQPSVPISIKIDAISRNLAELVYTGGSQTEVYSGNGITQVASIPTKTIPILSLQNQINSIN